MIITKANSYFYEINDVVQLKDIIHEQKQIADSSKNCIQLSFSAVPVDDDGWELLMQSLSILRQYTKTMHITFLTDDVLPYNILNKYNIVYDTKRLSNISTDSIVDPDLEFRNIWDAKPKTYNVFVRSVSDGQQHAAHHIEMCKQIYAKPCTVQDLHAMEKAVLQLGLYYLEDKLFEHMPDAATGKNAFTHNMIRGLMRWITSCAAANRARTISGENTSTLDENITCELEIKPSGSRENSFYICRIALENRKMLNDVCPYMATFPNPELWQSIILNHIPKDTDVPAHTTYAAHLVNKNVIVHNNTTGIQYELICAFVELEKLVKQYIPQAAAFAATPKNVQTCSKSGKVNNTTSSIFEAQINNKLTQYMHEVLKQVFAIICSAYNYNEDTLKTNATDFDIKAANYFAHNCFDQRNQTQRIQQLLSLPQPESVVIGKAVCSLTQTGAKSVTTFSIYAPETDITKPSAAKTNNTLVSGAEAPAAVAPTEVAENAHAAQRYNAIADNDHMPEQLTEPQVDTALETNIQYLVNMIHRANEENKQLCIRPDLFQPLHIYYIKKDATEETAQYAAPNDKQISIWQTMATTVPYHTAEQNEQIATCLLASARHFAEQFPELRPMFEQLKTILNNTKNNLHMAESQQNETVRKFLQQTAYKDGVRHMLEVTDQINNFVCKKVVDILNRIPQFEEHALEVLKGVSIQLAFIIHYPYFGTEGEEWINMRTLYVVANQLERCKDKLSFHAYTTFSQNMMAALDHDSTPTHEHIFHSFYEKLHDVASEVRLEMFDLLCETIKANLSIDSNMAKQYAFDVYEYLSSMPRDRLKHMLHNADGYAIPSNTLIWYNHV